jgi:predicted extracellular nuclease
MYKVILINEIENKRYEALNCKTFNEARKMVNRLNKIVGKGKYHTIEKCGG